MDARTNNVWWMHAQTNNMCGGRCMDDYMLPNFFSENNFFFKRQLKHLILILPKTESNKLGCGCWIRMMFS